MIIQVELDTDGEYMGEELGLQEECSADLEIILRDGMVIGISRIQHKTFSSSRLGPTGTHTIKF